MKTFSETYPKEIIPALKKELGCSNDRQVPALVKVVVNVGVGRSLKDPNFLEFVEASLAKISGQKPVRTRAKKSIAAFKIRQGMVVGFSVTMRKKRMVDFIRRFVTFALPRTRDFRGIDPASVDAHGNMALGIKESIIFPEIKSDEIEKIHGLEVCISTTAHTRERGLALFKALGFPFKTSSKK
ncbi:50S ribosomal protein L5 [Candidatus Uhrbacteria bacterium]|nr:50S ribosomal protein L5 [Candidatus Uhrbacteria bacterium]